MEKHCEICGSLFETQRDNKIYCDQCGKNPERARRNMAKAVYRNKVNAGDFETVGVKHVCIECGREFYSAERTTYCSNACLNAKIARTATCAVCGVLLMDKGIDTGRGLCSDECRQKRRLEKAIENGNYIPCKECGQKFISRNYANEFCSTDCRREYKRKEEEAKPPVVIGVRRITCAGCGKEYTRTENHVGYKYCSPNCRTLKAKTDKVKAQKPLNIGTDLSICTVCKTHQVDCERFQSKFTKFPRGAKLAKAPGKDSIVVACPKFKE